MKTKLLYFLIVILSVATSCKDNWNEYFNTNGDSTVGESKLDVTAATFFAEHPEYSFFYEQLRVCGLEGELSNTSQEITIWAVDNENFHQSLVSDKDTLRMKYHVNNLPFLFSDLKNGKRIKMMNGIYTQISKSVEDVYINDSKVIRSYRLNNAIVHVLDKMMRSKVNLFDYISSLPDSYSIFRDSIMKNNTKEFDKANSIPIGVDKTGNTVYDSVFYVNNPLFVKAKFNSEFEQFTLLLPNNEVVEECLSNFSLQYKAMGKEVLKTDSALAMTWIKEAAFYKGNSVDFSKTDVLSCFSRVWRTSVQLIDKSQREEMSNGVVYPITKLKIPNNYFLTRIKSLVHYWEYLTDVEKSQFYVFDGMKSFKITAGDATPKPDILPNYQLLDVTGTEDVNLWVEFAPLERFRTNETAPWQSRVMVVPTGEYQLYMGFRSAGHPNVNVYFDGDTDGKSASPSTKMKLIGRNLQAELSSPWNYDRVNETSADLYGDKISRWDGLGGLVGTVMVKGDDLSSFRIRVESNGSKKQLQIYHWALKPSPNNY